MESDMDKEAAQQFKAERYANQLVRNAFPEVRNVEKFEEWNKYAQDIYEQLKADLKVVFDEILPISPRCPVCGKFRKEPTKGLMAYQLAERLHGAYERLSLQFDDETRKETAVPWAQVPEQNRIFRIAVCAELLSRHIVLAAEVAGNGEQV